MEAKDILTLIIALAALFISLLTFYVNSLRKPRFKVVPGNSLQFFYFPNNTLSLTIPMVFFNQGSKHDIVPEVSGTLFDKGNKRKSDITWQAFFKYTSLGSDKEFKPFTEFDGWISPITVQAYDAVTKMIQFTTTREFDLLEGNYQIQFSYLRSLHSLRHRTVKMLFHVSSDNAIFLREKGVSDENGIAKGTLKIGIKEDLWIRKIQRLMKFISYPIGILLLLLMLLFGISRYTGLFTAREGVLGNAGRRWQLLAKPPGGDPIELDSYVDQEACKAIQQSFMRMALNQGYPLPILQCKNLYPWWMQFLSWIERL